MKTKIYTLLLFICTTGTAFACGDSTCVRKDDFKFWQGLDIGVNGYMLPDYTLSTPAGYDFLDIDYARSRSIAWNIGQYNVHLCKNYVNLVTGIGLEWDSYALRKNVTLSTTTSPLSATEETFSFSKNKLKSTWLDAPLLLEFNTSSVSSKSFHIGLGATFGYNIFRNREKQEFSSDGNNTKRKIKDDFNVDPFRCSLTARVGYGDVSLFANYGLTTLFNSGEGPEVHPFSAGIGLSF